MKSGDLVRQKDTDTLEGIFGTVQKVSSRPIPFGTDLA